MTRALGDIRSGLVLLVALAASGVGWWLVLAEPGALPGVICGVDGIDAGPWSMGLLVGRIGMWVAMMLAMAGPVGMVIGMRGGGAADAAFLAGYVMTAAGVAVVAAFGEWVAVSLGIGGLGPRSGLIAGAAFAALGVVNICAAAIRKSASCMRDDGLAGTDASRGLPLVSSGEKVGAASISLPDNLLHGLHQGRASLACSITMVGLQLILGTMSLVVMLAMTLWMLAEALLPERRELPLALGAALIVAGLSIITTTAVT